MAFTKAERRKRLNRLARLREEGELTELEYIMQSARVARSRAEKNKLLVRLRTRRKGLKLSETEWQSFANSILFPLTRKNRHRPPKRRRGKVRSNWTAFLRSPRTFFHLVQGGLPGSRR